MTTEPTQLSDNAGRSQRFLWLGVLIAGYIGVYLCRKNLSVAIPLLQEAFHASRAEIGVIASYSTVAYAIGKFVFGATVDRVGGRTGFLGSLLLVCLMGAAGGFAPSLGWLALFYSLSRFAGAAGWPSMMKLTPQWFSVRQAPFAIAWLSLSWVVGSACGNYFAGWVVSWSKANWRVVMAAPSVVLLLVWLACWALLPKDPAAAATGEKKKNFSWSDLAELLASGQFWIVCAMSFILTLMRETFNTWMPDFIKTQGGPDVSIRLAATLSTLLDILGGLGILVVGWAFGRLANKGKKALLSTMLALLAILLYYLPSFFHMGLTVVTLAIGVIGFLTFGPYSLLAGTLSLEVGGKRRVATVSGIVDGVGYFAGVLAGAKFGQLVDRFGYPTGFHVLAGLAALSAICAVILQHRTESPDAIS